MQIDEELQKELEGIKIHVNLNRGNGIQTPSLRLIGWVETLLQVNEGLKGEVERLTGLMEQYRHDAKMERELSADIVDEREKLIVEVERYRTALVEIAKGSGHGVDSNGMFIQSWEVARQALGNHS